MAWRVLLGALSCCLVAGCTPVPPAIDGPKIHVGAVFNLTGSQAVLDVPSSRGATLAFDQINASGGVLGHTLIPVPVIGESQPAELGGRLETALSDTPSIAAFLGLSDTDNVHAAATVAQVHGRVFLTSGATSPKLPEAFPNTVLLACFGDNVQAAAGAEWAYHTLGARRVHLLADMDLTYPRLLQGYFLDGFRALGGTVTRFDTIQPRADELTLPQPGDVDLVYLSVETAEDAARVIAALRDAGYQGPILGGDGYDAPSVWATAPDLGDVYFTTHVLSRPRPPQRPRRRLRPPLPRGLSRRIAHRLRRPGLRRRRPDGGRDHPRRHRRPRPPRRRLLPDRQLPGRHRPHQLRPRHADPRQVGHLDPDRQRSIPFCRRSDPNPRAPALRSTQGSKRETGLERATFSLGIAPRAARYASETSVQPSGSQALRFGRWSPLFQLSRPLCTRPAAVTVLRRRLCRV